MDDLNAKVIAANKKIAAISNDNSKLEARIEEIKNREKCLTDALGVKQNSLDILNGQIEQIKKEINEVVTEKDEVIKECLAKEEVQNENVRSFLYYLLFLLFLLAIYIFSLLYLIPIRYH